MSPSSRTSDHSREVLAARVPAKVREAFDAAVDAHRRFQSAFSMPSGPERMSVRRAAVNDLTAANRILGRYQTDLPQKAQRAAQSGGAR